MKIKMEILKSKKQSLGLFCSATIRLVMFTAGYHDSFINPRHPLIVVSNSNSIRHGKGRTRERRVRLRVYFLLISKTSHVGTAISHPLNLIENKKKYY